MLENKGLLMERRELAKDMHIYGLFPSDVLGFCWYSDLGERSFVLVFRDFSQPRVHSSQQLTTAMQEHRRAELEAKRARLAELKKAREERQKAAAENVRRRESEVRASLSVSHCSI